MKSRNPDSGPLHRVLLVDPDDAFGARLFHLLSEPNGFKLLGHIACAAAAESLLTTMEHIDLVVVDIDLEDGSALRLLSRRATAFPQRRLVAVARRCDAEAAEHVLQLGVAGVLLKTEPARELLEAFRTILRGEICVSDSLMPALLKRLLAKPSSCAGSGIESLTGRELRVFELLGFGLNKREVATRLGVSCKTVESHRTKIQHRLGLPNAAALTQFACAWVQRGLSAPTLDFLRRE